MSLGQFFPTNEMMSPFSMYLSFKLIPKLVPVEHLKKFRLVLPLQKILTEMTDVNWEIHLA